MGGVSYSIAEAAERSGLSVDTLRYYEKAGLLEPPARDSAGRRSYTEADMAWVSFLLRLRSTGMPIRLMREYAQLRRIGPDTAARRREILVEHRTEIQLRMAEMASFIEVLDYKITNYAEIAAGCLPQDKELQ